MKPHPTPMHAPSPHRSMTAEHFGALSLPVGEFLAMEHDTEYVAANREVRHCPCSKHGAARMVQGGGQQGGEALPQ